MSKPASTSTRVAGDVVAIASAVAPGEHRTIAEQINHWARIGMQVERSGTIATRKVLAVAAGEEQFATLDSEERETAHARHRRSDRRTGRQPALRPGRPGGRPHDRLARRGRQPHRDHRRRNHPAPVSRLDLIAGPNGAGKTNPLRTRHLPGPARPPIRERRRHRRSPLRWGVHSNELRRR